MPALHPLKRRLLAEDFVRLRRADEQRRYAASQRRGRIDPNPHQIDAVIFALKRIPEGGCILADEVGLGKTIEAGLVISQLLAEGKRRILLIVPKSLLGQWRMELYTLFGIEVREARPDPDAFVGEGVFLVHREFAGGPRGSSLLQDADPFDLAVIDEAHEVFAGIYRRYDKDGNYDDNPDSKKARMADRVRRSLLKPPVTPVLLLTATPIQNSLTELWGLVQFIEPTGMLLGKLPTFREVFCASEDRVLVAGQEFELRRRLGSVLQRTLRRQAQEFLAVPFVERQAKLIEYAMSPDEKALYNDVTEWLMDPNNCAFGGNHRRLLVIGFHRRMASSLAALAASLEKVAARLGGQLESEQLASDFAHDLEEDLEELKRVVANDPKEGTAGQELEEDDEDLDTLPSVDTTAPPPSGNPHAEVQRIEGFIQRAKAIPRESKATGLLDALKPIRERAALSEGTGKVVIFTESLRTQDFLHDLLKANGYRPEEITLFRGQNNSPRADEALKRWQEEVGDAIPPANRPSRDVALRLALVDEFRKRSKVFISTEAGAKGLNLQFCETVINYDLPWNPQRIEQRIGRVHRYGQKRGVIVLNFLDRDNEGQRLTFDILSQKLDLFGKVLDASDVVLHTPSTDFPESLVSGFGLDFERQLRRIYGQARSLAEIADQLRALRDSMADKRRQFDDEQKRTADLIASRLDDSVQRAFQGYRDALPAGLEQLDRDIDSLVGGFLEAVGAGFERTEDAGRIIYQIRKGPDLLDGTFLIGQVHDLKEGEPLHLGHPLVRAAVAEARKAPVQPAVELGPGPNGLPACLAPHIGKRGRLVVTKAAYRGMEPVDHLLVTALLEQDDAPLDGLTVEALLALSMRDGAQPECPPAVDRAILKDAIEEAVLVDQIETTSRKVPTNPQTRNDQSRLNGKDKDLFFRKLEQLDRYLEDQILVLKRKRAKLQRQLAETEAKKQRAVAPSERTQAEEQIQTLEKKIKNLNGRIERLQEGEDDDYKTWRDRLYERRYQRPTVEPILEVVFRVGGEGVSC
jgi:hypothetical protein